MTTNCILQQDKCCGTSTEFLRFQFGVNNFITTKTSIKASKQRVQIKQFQIWDWQAAGNLFAPCESSALPSRADLALILPPVCRGAHETNTVITCPEQLLCSAAASSAGDPRTTRSTYPPLLNEGRKSGRCWDEAIRGPSGAAAVWGRSRPSIHHLHPVSQWVAPLMSGWPCRGKLLVIMDCL